MKRLLSGLCVILLVLVMISPAAYAATTSDTVAMVAAANDAIDARIAKAQDDANKLLALNAVLTEQAKSVQQRKAIDQMTDAGLDVIIASLLRDTNRISAQTITAAAEAGVTVKCFLVEVIVGGRSVMVDPLVVCNE
ncbi:MAG: hypothetical protein ACM3ZQ_06635 [Bacillota bacterium]